MNLIRLPKEEIPKVSQGLIKGRSATDHSWFYEVRDSQGKNDDHASDSIVFSRLMPKIESIKDLYPGLYSFEQSKLKKWGPQGEAAPLRERMDTLEHYYSYLSEPLIIHDRLWSLAKKNVVTSLGFNESGSPFTVEMILQRGLSEQKFNTSSGYPLYARRNSPEALQEARDNALSSIDKHYPTTLGVRANIGHTGKDARHIFMASMSVNVKGQRFAVPVQDYLRLKQVEFFTPWEGWDSTQSRISSLWSNEGLKVGADYSKMDQHFNKFHMHEVFDVLKHYFQKKYWPELSDVIDYVTSMPVIIGQYICYDEHSLPSGSEWTNLSETVWNYIFTEYLRLKYHIPFQLRMGIGDDQLWILNLPFSEKTKKWMQNVLITEFHYAGMEGNITKQEIDNKEVGFLQRYLCNQWNGLPDYNQLTKGAGIYSLIRNANSLCYPEFHHEPWNGEMFALRCIMIAENCSQHPLFEWYVTQFLAEGNSHILEFVRSKPENINSAIQVAKSIANFLPSYTGAASFDKGIETFRTFQFLKSLSKK